MKTAKTLWGIFCFVLAVLSFVAIFQPDMLPLFAKNATNFLRSAPWVRWAALGTLLALAWTGIFLLEKKSAREVVYYRPDGDMHTLVSEYLDGLPIAPNPTRKTLFEKAAQARGEGRFPEAIPLFTKLAADPESTPNS